MFTGEPFFLNMVQLKKIFFLLTLKKLLGSFFPPILWCNCWLNMIQQQVLQEILKISYQDRITNEEVLRRANALSLADIVAQRQFRFAEHILHLPFHWPANDAMTW